MALRRINPSKQPLIHLPRRFSSSSNPPFPPPSPPPTDDPDASPRFSSPPTPNNGERRPAGSSLFSDVRERLRSSPASPAPRPIPMNPPRHTGQAAGPTMSLEDISRSLQSFRAASRNASTPPPISGGGSDGDGDGSALSENDCGSAGYWSMVGWRAVGARAVLRRLDGRVFAASYSSFSSSASSPFGLGQCTNLLKAHTFTSRGIPPNFHQLIRNAGISTTTNMLAEENAMVPVSSPLTSPLGNAEETDKKGAVVKKLKVQAIKKDIKQSPKKVNLVAKLVRGMRVEDALLQLQVTVKRAAKTLYEVIHSARANAAHNHGLDPDKLLVEEAFVGKGLYLKRLSYHAKGRCGLMERPRCRLTVVVREATAEEEAKIAKLRVSNYKKLTRKEKQLMPHRLIEVSPKWARKSKEEAGATS